MESSEVNPTYTPLSPVEEPIVDAITALVERLRDPEQDLVDRVQHAEPLVEALGQQWSAADIPTPSAVLLGHARTLKVELDMVKSKLSIRGRSLARMRRAVDDARGTTYDKSAARDDNGGGRVRDLSL